MTWSSKANDLISYAYIRGCLIKFQKGTCYFLEIHGIKLPLRFSKVLSSTYNHPNWNTVTALNVFLSPQAPIPFLAYFPKKIKGFLDWIASIISNLTYLSPPWQSFKSSLTVTSFPLSQQIRIYRLLYSKQLGMEEHRYNLPLRNRSTLWELEFLKSNFRIRNSALKITDCG